MKYNSRENEPSYIENRHNLLFLAVSVNIPSNYEIHKPDLICRDVQYC